MHKLVIVSGLIACWFGLDRVVKWCMKKKWFLKLTSYSFIIYALHVPLVAFAINGSLAIFQNTTGGRMIAFVALPLAAISLCVLVAIILKMLLPRVYALITGGR
jgi:peptidoglycan/LPS O-acetylase OafA/YrhL